MFVTVTLTSTSAGPELFRSQGLVLGKLCQASPRWEAAAADSGNQSRYFPAERGHNPPGVLGKIDRNLHCLTGPAGGAHDTEDDERPVYPVGTAVHDLVDRQT